MVRVFAVLTAALVLGAPAQASWADERWTGSWATSEQIPEDRNALPAHALDDATLRQTVHLSIQGKSLRVRLSNAFGTAPLHITAAHLARAVASGSDAIEPASDTALRFSGAADVTIPAGAEYVSDPVQLTGADLAVTLHFETTPAQQTSHPGSRTTSYLLHGDHVADPALPGAEKFDHWFNIAGIDVTGGAGAVVALGDSITDGRGSTTNGNDRWTDALVQPDARWLIVFEAINDIGTFDPDGSKSQAAHQALVRQLVTAYSQMIESAHAAGIKVFGATITPFMDCGPYHPKPVSEADRMAVNAWSRTHFDAVIDFDAAVRDPARPDHLAPAYDSGDGLHLSPAGYRAMAAAIPLSLFR
jgi:lysophospholipase L1-like esterase